jgi:hypothetical protein
MVASYFYNQLMVVRGGGRKLFGKLVVSQRSRFGTVCAHALSKPLPPLNLSANLFLPEAFQPACFYSLEEQETKIPKAEVIKLLELLLTAGRFRKFPIHTLSRICNAIDQISSGANGVVHYVGRQRLREFRVRVSCTNGSERF